MPVVHLVLLSFKATTTPEAINLCLRELRSLTSLVPGVLQLSCGENFTTRGREFTHALTVHLADKAALDAYAVHPGALAARSETGDAGVLRGRSALRACPRPPPHPRPPLAVIFSFFFLQRIFAW